MSRIGKSPINIPSGIEVKINDGVVEVKGPKGTLTHVFRSEIGMRVEDNKVICDLNTSIKESPAYWGLTRALVSNMIKGVEKGFEKKLELVGVGYRVQSKGKSELSLTVGFSHPVEFTAPVGVEFEVESNKEITIKGIDKQLVGLTAAKIKKIRPPEPYKGKGIRYVGETVRTKPGKTGKGSA